MGNFSNNTSIVFWNARGVSNKKSEYFNYLEYNIPIALLNETHLKPSIKFKCPNYCVYRSDRENRPGGGTAILIRKEIQHFEIFLPKLQHMEATPIQLYINKELVTLISIYNPPGKILEADLDLLFQTGNKVTPETLMQNIAHGTLEKIMLWVKICAPTSPTHISDNDPASADILDLAILHNVLAHHTIRTLGNLSHSDHRPVMLTIRGPVQSHGPKTTYVYKEANWQYSQSLVLSII
jgi:hypothetical protein